MASVWFEDDEFLDSLVGLLLKDRAFGRAHAGMLDPDDFKARTGAPHSADRWIIANKALDYYARYREPANKLIVPELKHYAKVARLSEKKTDSLVKLARGYLKRRFASEAVGERVVEFKQQVLKQAAMDELAELQGAGKLDDAAWQEVTRKAILDRKVGSHEINYFQTVSDRNLRRLQGRGAKYPYLFIEPIDMQVRAVSRGQVGLVMAPWKGRKSLCLLHISLAYCLQGLNVLFYTLEDPLEVVEDRLDAQITHIPIKLLSEKTNLIERRFPRYTRMVGKNLKLVDYTGGGLTLAQVELDIERLKLEEDFQVDAVIVDYDDEITPRKKNERRFEFAEIYRDARQLASRQDVIFWTAAQCNKESEGKKIITGKDLAEDVSKVRKVSFAMSIGAGDFGDKSNYVYVAAHKNDKKFVGGNIVGDPERMIFCDYDATSGVQERGPKKKKRKAA